MPTYAYKCTNCGYEYEKFQPISAPTIDTCEKCGGEAKRMISGGAGIIFKGTGFYVTDYKNSSNGKSKSKTNEATKNNSENNKTKTENKTAKKENVA